VAARDAPMRLRPLFSSRDRFENATIHAGKMDIAPKKKELLSVWKETKVRCMCVECVHCAMWAQKHTHHHTPILLKTRNKTQTKQNNTSNKALTKEINRANESRISGMATQTGGTLAVVGKKAPPPVLAPASQKVKKSGRNAPEEKPDPAALPP
jgi:hypothetical protein